MAIAVFPTVSSGMLIVSLHRRQPEPERDAQRDMALDWSIAGIDPLRGSHGVGWRRAQPRGLLPVDSSPVSRARRKMGCAIYTTEIDICTSNFFCVVWVLFPMVLKLKNMYVSEAV
ncbi:hypothetical protein ACQJBY_017097 [Aegilops geniculata]